MREYIFYMWAGVWLLLLPFLGIPGRWKDTLMMLTAFCFITYALVSMRRNRLKETHDNDEARQHGNINDGSSSPSI